MAKYEPTSFFFTDYSALSAPTAADAFGPVAGNLTTQYRTTSFVNGTGKLYAICDGQLLIQPQTGSTSKVNLILKPGKSYNGPKVKYFIYRNVNMSDLINGNNLVDKNDADPNQPDILKRIWKEFLDFNMPFYNQGIISTPPDTIPAIQIGYGQQPATTLIDHVFSYKNATEVYQIPSCSKGEFIGNFTGKIGLDVVLDYGDYELTNQDELFRLDLSFARAATHVFDTTNPTINTPVKIKQYREHILQFMDAAALWGSHINCGTIETVHGDKKTAAEIGTDILSKYFTKDKVYVYIQGENDRSYNYYDTVRKVYGFNPAGEIAQTNEWPILIKQLSMTSSDQEIDIQLDYTIDANIPVLQRHIAVDVFAANGNDLDEIYPRIERPENTTDKTQSIDIKFYGNSSLSYASFLFLYGNLKQDFPVVDYYNSLWTVNIEPIFSIDSNIESAIYYTDYNCKRLVNLDDTLSSGASVQNKVVFDNGLNKTTQVRKKRRLYLAILQANGEHDDEHNGYNITEVTSGSSMVIRTSLDYLNTIYYKARQEKSLNFAVYKGTFTDSSITDPINSLCLVHHQNILKKNSYYHLGITDEEYNKLIYNDPAPISTTPQYLPTDAQKVQFYLNEITTFTHENIRKFEVGLWYEDNTGVRITTAKYPTGTNKVYVYTMDGYFFFSKEYSDHQEFYRQFSKAAVEFRTAFTDIHFLSPRPMIPAYKGEFGFDWLRVDDGATLDTRPSYQSTINGGYHRPHRLDTSTEFPNGIAAYKALKREYWSIPMQENNKQYFIPYLSLFSQNFSNTVNTNPVPPYEGSLRVYINFPEYIHRIELDYDLNYLSITPSLLTDSGTTAGFVESAEKAITITCTKEFSTPLQIRVWAYPLPITSRENAELAGIIIVNKNDIKSVKEAKIALVEIWTDLTNTGNNEEAEYMPIEITNTYNILHQNLSYGYIQQGIVFDLTQNTNFKNYIDPNTGNLILGNYVASNDGILKYNRVTGQLIHEYLKTLFLATGTNNIYNDHFLTFAFDLSDENYSIYGHVADIGVPLVVVYNTNPGTTNPPRDETTLNHETMHGYGLYHTHKEKYTNGNIVPITEPEKKYTYPNANDLAVNDKEKATDNVMSYNKNAITLWQWQKQFINIKK